MKSKIDTLLLPEKWYVRHVATKLESELAHSLTIIVMFLLIPVSGIVGFAIIEPMVNSHYVVPGLILVTSLFWVVFLIYMSDSVEEKTTRCPLNVMKAANKTSNIDTFWRRMYGKDEEWAWRRFRTALRMFFVHVCILIGLIIVLGIWYI